MESLKEKIKSFYNFNTHFFIMGVFLLSFLFFNIAISTTFFIFNISIKSFYTILALLLSIGMTVHILAKKKMVGEKLIRNVVLTIIIPIAIILASIWLNGKVLDYTWDGNSYQKGTVRFIG